MENNPEYHIIEVASDGRKRYAITFDSYEEATAMKESIKKIPEIINKLDNIADQIYVIKFSM